MNDTIESKLYKAHELLREVGECLDLNDPLTINLMTAQNYIYLVGRRLPRNMLKYIPKKDRNE